MEPAVEAPGESTGARLPMADLHARLARNGAVAHARRLDPGSGGPLDCAVELHNGGRTFHLVRSRRWYDAQPPLLP
ncbi:hypothetical protein GCM10027359_02620 [Marilutibacter aestuarii]